MDMTMKMRAARKRTPNGRKAALAQAKLRIPETRTARKIQMRQRRQLLVLTNQML